VETRDKGNSHARIASEFNFGKSTDLIQSGPVIMEKN